MNSTYQVQELGNTRYLYLEGSGIPRDWITQYQILLDYIEKSPQLDEFSNHCCLFFFEPLSEIPIEDMDHWVATPVIGFEIVPEESELALFDGHKGEAFIRSIEAPINEFSWELVLKNCEEFEQELLESGKSIGRTWSLKIYDSMDAVSCIDIQYFNKL